MRTWRLLLDVDGQVWTFLVAAQDHLQAWWLVNKSLAPARRKGASLEELEATGVPSKGPARVLAAWLGVPLPKLSREGTRRTG